jgi:hypothetical protein
MTTVNAETKTTRRSNRGTVEGHPHLSRTLVLSDVQQERLEKFRKSLGPIATRGQLKKANKAEYGMKASPTYITKNVAFQIKGMRGLYSLVAQDGVAATKAAIQRYMEAKEKAASKDASKVKSAKPVKKAKKAKKAASTKAPATQPVAEQVAAS